MAISRKQKNIDELKALAVCNNSEMRRLIIIIRSFRKIEIVSLGLYSDPELIIPLLLDIGDWDKAKELVKPAIANRRVHFLVNNATVPVPQTFETISPIACSQLFDQIIKAPINFAQVIVALPNLLLAYAQLFFTFTIQLFHSIICNLRLRIHIFLIIDCSSTDGGAANARRAVGRVDREHREHRIRDGHQ